MSWRVNDDDSEACDTCPGTAHPGMVSRRHVESLCALCLADRVRESPRQVARELHAIGLPPGEVFPDWLLGELETDVPANVDLHDPEP